MKTKRFLSMILTLALVLSLFSGASTVTAEADGGDVGSTPIEISDKSGLKNVSGGGIYKLTKDINLAGEDWTPLPAFSGKLDGAGHVIRNLSITDTTDATGNNKGLFTSIAGGGEVCSLGIEDANITAGDNAGIIAAANAGSISRCHTTGTISGDGYVGGIAGTNSGTIDNCYSRASVSGTDNLGGLAGSNSGTIEKCYTASTVTDSVFNNYLQFNAVAEDNHGGYIEIPHNNEYTTGTAFTLEAWFQWDDVGTATIGFIIGKGFEQFEIHTGGNALTNGLRFIPVPEGGKSDGLGGYASDSYIDVHDVLQTGWFHVAAVYWYESEDQEANAQVYVNGEAQELWQIPSAGATATSCGITATLSRTSNPLASSTSPVSIGKRTNNSYYFDGKIADVRFWNTARTGEQIKANKDKTLTGSEDGLVGYWKLNDNLEGSLDGKTVADSSSINNSGTIYGNVTQTKGHGASNKGALVGSNTTTVAGCFYDSTVYGASGDTNGTATGTSEMKVKGTYTDWDFEKIWRIDTDEYPSFWSKESTPDATFTATGSDTGTLSNVENGMQYKINGGEWTDISDTTAALTGLSAGTISVMKKGDGTTTLDSDVQTITVTGVATPVITPNGGTFTGSQGVTITCETEDAGIYYTTDGAIPTASSTEYSVPFTVSSTTVVKAFAVKDGLINSSLATATFTKHSGGGHRPSEPAAPVAPVEIDGKTENIGAVETTNSETKVTVDSTKLTENIESAQEGGSVIVEVDNSKDTATAQLLVKNVEEMAKKEMSLTVQTGGVSYEVPTAAIDTAAIMQELGAANPADVPINVTITKADNSGEAEVSSAVQVVGASLVLPPVSFSVTATYGDKTVEVKRFDSFVPRQVEIDEEQAKRITTAIVYESDGTLRHVPTFVYEKDGRWYARINSRTNSLYAFISNDKSFSDAEGKWFEETINEMASRKIINGRDENIFAGDDNITRAEFVAIVIHALGLPEGSTENFSDVSESDWFFGVAAAAEEYSLIKGRGDHRFEPKKNITRQEAMIIIQRAAEIAGFSSHITSAEDFTEGFVDINEVGSWALEAVNFNVSNGLIKGTDLWLDPTHYITRAETATVVLRLLQKAGLVDIRSKV